MSVEVAYPQRCRRELTAGLFREMESGVRTAGCYRDRVLSLEKSSRFDGTGSSIRVQRLEPVRPEHLIMPAHTRALIDRNVLTFATHREQLRALGQSTKKGILLYGPPGNGKTHTIRYLASNLPGHTTLIITAEQAGLLPEYFALARLMHPALLVIEYVYLLSRNREQMGTSCHEVLPNPILNPMDCLSDDADLFFVLTTNRPSRSSRRFAARPGRIDQTIEIRCRMRRTRKLVRSTPPGSTPPASRAEAAKRTG